MIKKHLLKYFILLIFVFFTGKMNAGFYDKDPFSNAITVLDSLPPVNNKTEQKNKTSQHNNSQAGKGKNPAKQNPKTAGNVKVKTVPAAKNKPRPVRVGQLVKVKPIKVVKPKVGKGIR